MILHRTLLRFVVTIMLLSMATLFGAAYMPAVGSVTNHETPPVEIVFEMELGKVFIATAQSHDCDKDGAEKLAGDDVRCATDCSYFLAPDLFSFAPSGQRFSLSLASMIWMGESSAILRPPIA